MKTTINIGTSRGNMVGIEIDKPFNEIRYADILKIVTEKFKDANGARIDGWCDVSPIKNSIKQTKK